MTIHKVLFITLLFFVSMSSFAKEDRTGALDLSPAKWIWYPAGRTLQNTFILFRKDVILKEKPSKADGYWRTADIVCL